MSSLAFLLLPELMPFALALGLVAALCLLEGAMLLSGLSLLGAGAGEAEADLAPGLDAGTPDGDIAGAAEADPAAPAGDGLAEGDVGAGAVAGLLSWLGLGRVPFMVWLAGALTAFGLAGYALQSAAAALLGAPLPALGAAAVALLPGLAAGGALARLVARLVPRLETSAISTRSYGGRRGVITTGIARRGAPAEARFRDGHGNTHYAMVEPMHDGERLAAGTPVAILRLRDGALRAIRLDDPAR